MKSVKYLLLELRNEILKVIIINSFLDAVMLFLVLHLLFSIIHIYPLFTALIPSLIVFFVLIITKLKIFKLKTIEDKNPDVKEILRTAADNIDDETFVVHELHKELIRKMRHVASSTFVKLNSIAYKVVGITVISFLTVFLAASNMYLIDLNDIISSNLGPLLASGDDDIYGEDEDLAELGDKPMKVKINPLSYEINIDKVSDTKDEEFKGEFPDEIYASHEAAYEENIPREQQEIVKNYFSKILK